MKKNNILYLVTKLELGGAQKHLLDLITHLDASRYNIFLFTAKKGFLVSEAASIPKIQIKLSEFLERPINPLKDVFALFEIYSFIKNNNIDIVHTHSSKAGIVGRIAARLAGVKIIVHTVHGWSFNDFQPFLLKHLYIWLERFCALFSSKIIVVSDCDKTKGLRYLIGSPDKYAVIRYGIDLGHFLKTSHAALNKAVTVGKPLIVGMIACFKPQKDPEAFIRLAHLMLQDFPSVKFLLVGDGVLRKDIEKLITGLKVEKNVDLLGWREDIAQLLSVMDIFVLTSLWEGLPISVLEAMASGKPVIATDTGGVREVISEGKTGFLVQPKDIKTMAEKLKILLSDDCLRVDMGLRAREALGKQYSIDFMIQSSEIIYDCLLKEKYNQC